MNHTSFLGFRALLDEKLKNISFDYRSIESKSRAWYACACTIHRVPNYNDSVENFFQTLSQKDLNKQVFIAVPKNHPGFISPPVTISNEEKTYILSGVVAEDENTTYYPQYVGGRSIPEIIAIQGYFAFSYKWDPLCTAVAHDSGARPRLMIYTDIETEKSLAMPSFPAINKPPENQ
jgi:hypothetical protein